MFFQYVRAVWNAILRRGLTNFLLDREVKLLDLTSGSFSLVTYNIAGLPQVISSAKTYRATSIANIGVLLNDFDVVCVQEDFNYNNQLYNSGNLHQYRSLNMGLALFGDGLSVLSKYSLSDFRRIKWRNGTGSDRLTPKGFSFCRLHLANGVDIDFYNIHANAQNFPRAAHARQQNLIQLAAYIKSNSEGKALIVAGDFNAHFQSSIDNLNYFMNETNLIDTWVLLENDEKIPESNSQFLCVDIMDIDDQTESIDKIMFRSNAEITLIPSKYHVEKEDFVDNQGIPLSDHWPISVHFDWNLNKE